MPASPAISLSSPSFSSYSKSNLAEIAARVVEEFRAENGKQSEFFGDDELLYALESDKEFIARDSSKEENDAGDSDGGDEEEFEFKFVPGETKFSSIPADEIFYNGQIRPIFPIFDRSLLLGDADFGNGSFDSTVKSGSGVDQKVSTLPPKIRLPLRKLFNEEREAQSSCSSSEADELDGIPPGTYCVWRPKASSPSCKKSNSTGWSKRWKFRNLIHRSNSDGKDTFVFLTPSFKKLTHKLEKPAAAEASNTAEKPAASPHSAKSEGGRRRPFSPYRPDFVGFFANANGLSRSLQPF